MTRAEYDLYFRTYFLCISNHHSHEAAVGFAMQDVQQRRERYANRRPRNSLRDALRQEATNRLATRRACNAANAASVENGLTSWNIS